jgi:hypothetical protein
MTYQLRMIQKPAYLHVIVTGQNSRETAVAYLAEIRSECIARGCFRVLDEERLEGPRLGMMDVFQIVEQESKQAAGLYKAFAYVDVNAEGDLMQFAETVGVNRGVALAVFATVAQAEAWLIEESSSTGSDAAAEADKPGG